MNIYELIHLAADASGGGISYSVSFHHDAVMRGAADVTVTRWDSVYSRYITYNDKNHQMMKDTSMRDDYRPLCECVKIMKDDAEKMAMGYTPPPVNATAQGIATRRKIIDFVRKYRNDHGQSPTQWEIAIGIGHSQGSNFLQLLRDMRTSGLIHFNDHLARTIVVNEKGVREWEESLK